MNRNEKLEIAKRLRHSTEMEMSRDDLEQLLDAELTKPEAEMDAELVQQILELLEDAPSPVQQHASWQKLNKRLSFKRWQPVMMGLARFAAIVVMLVVLTYASYGTAQALNWEFLLRLMRPFAETFMVYTGNKPGPISLPKTQEVYSDDKRYHEQVEFTVLADCPETIGGYPTKPIWVPDRFTYVQGSLYSDALVTSVTHVFSCNDGYCIIDITLLEDENDMDLYQFEQVPAENTTLYAGGYQITVYRNSDNETLTVSWLVDNVHYSITGAITEEEVTIIIDSMLK